MKFKPLFSKKESAASAEKKAQKPSVDEVLSSTNQKLIVLKKKYRVLLEKELIIARDNKERGKKNSANYSRIGAAYYSLNIINSAQERLNEMQNTRDLFNCMNEMGAALSTINGMSGKVGKLNPKKIMDQMNKMSKSSTGAGKDLIKTLEGLSNANTDRPEGVPVDDLVSKDMIEKLIEGDTVEECIRSGEGLNENADDLMAVFSEVMSSPEMMESSEGEMSMEDIQEMLNNL